VAELEKRRTAGLSARQEELLSVWGYPYVMDEFRFHMTLTGPCADDGEADAVLAGLAPLTTDLAAQPLRVDGICLFHQVDRSADFTLLQRFALAGQPAGAERHTHVMTPS
jgi:hypothetical protein